MRILLITWNYPPKVGGMEMMLSRLVQNMLPHVKSVDIVGPYAGPKNKDDRSKNIFRPARNGLLYYLLFSLVQGRHLLKNNQYDVLVAGSALLTPVVYLLGKIFKVPVVVNVYGLDLIYSNTLYQWMVRTFLKRCTQIVAISQAAKNEAVRLGVLVENIVIIHPGVDFSEFANKPDVSSVRKLYQAGQRPILLSAGRLAKRKGVLEFIRFSLPEIVKSYPDLLFLVVGENPKQSLAHKEDMMLLIEQEIELQELTQNVQLLGRLDRDELVNLYHTCDIFILPAINIPGDMEGFGIVLLEASASGKPVISTNLGGIPDAVAANESGLIIEAEHWLEFTNAVVKLLSNPSLRDKLGRQGCDRVQKEFDWPIVGVRYAANLAKFQEAGVATERIL